MPHVSDLDSHIEELAQQVKALRAMVPRARPPRWPWALVALLTAGGLVAIWHALQVDPHAAAPVVAPIVPTGEAAQRLWLP